MENVTNMIRVESNSYLDVSPEGDFFRLYVEFLKPLHKLTNREMDVLAAFLKKRHELSKVITREDVLDEMLMSMEVKKQIWEACGLKSKHFQMVMIKLRKNGVIKNNRIRLNLIPTVTKSGVGLMIFFDFNKKNHVKLDYRPSSQKA